MLSIYRFPNKLEGEEVIKIVRRDLFILVKKILFLVVLILLPLVFFNLLILSRTDILNGTLAYPLIVIGISAYYLFMWLFFFFSFIDYYLDVWVITNERIIDIQQQGFFSRIISEQKLFRIQDVTSEVHGAIPTILAYGYVHVQTAGTRERFVFQQVPYPDRIRDMIIKLVEHNKKKHGINNEQAQ